MIKLTGFEFQKAEHASNSDNYRNSSQIFCQTKIHLIVTCTVFTLVHAPTLSRKLFILICESTRVESLMEAQISWIRQSWHMKRKAGQLYFLFFRNGHCYQKIIQNLWMILRLQLTVAVYSWSIANNFVIDVYQRFYAKLD